MAKSDPLIRKSPYFDKEIVLVSKHNKAVAIEPIFNKVLGAKVKRDETDTDTLGTFSGEVERNGTAYEVARNKCLMANESSKFVLASEGSYGPHPYFPFIPAGKELLLFMDKERDLEVQVSLLSEKTNYNTHTIKSKQQLYTFAKHAHFPSHSLILRPDKWLDKSIIFKGINSQQQLENAFDTCQQAATDGCVLVQTDMRANHNPTRMALIMELAEQLAQRLLQSCPNCEAPGWGKIDVKTGLPCESCGIKTKQVKNYVFGCAKCEYKQDVDRLDGVKLAEAQHCDFCNP